MSFVNVGPIGGGGGDGWWDGILDSLPTPAFPPPNLRIAGIKVRHKNWIDAITFGTLPLNTPTPNDINQIHWLQRHGGDGGDEDIIVLQQNEHILQMFGTSGDYIDKLTIAISNGAHMTFGFGGGYNIFDFSVPFINNQFHGFIAGCFGRSHTYLDAIGCIQFIP